VNSNGDVFDHDHDQQLVQVVPLPLHEHAQQLFPLPFHDHDHELVPLPSKDQNQDRGLFPPNSWMRRGKQEEHAILGLDRS